MNVKLLTSTIIFSFTPSLYAEPLNSDMTVHEMLRARQACERSQPRAVCAEMERARYQELREQRTREPVERQRESRREREDRDNSWRDREHRGRENQGDRDDRDYRDRDNDRDRRDDRGRDRDERWDRDNRRDDRDADTRAYCRHHPEVCEAQRREEERAERQTWCERKFSRQQCLEMERHEPSSHLPNRRDRDDRTRDIDRHDRREQPRVIQPREIPNDRPYPYRRPAQD